jgi:hypothetical protein
LSEQPDLKRALQLTGADEFFRECLEEDQILKLGEVIRRLNNDEAWILSTQPWMFSGDFAAYALQRVERMKANDLDGWGPLFGYPPAICAHIVAKYVAAENFHSANAWGSLIAASPGDFDNEQVTAILEGAIANSEIQGSFELPKVLSALRQANKITADLEPLMEQIE